MKKRVIEFLVLALIFVAFAIAAPPAIPTQVSGYAKYSDGILATGAVVEASWINSDGERRSASTTSISEGSLRGQYSFGNLIDALSGSDIEVSFLGGTIVLEAQPGVAISAPDLIAEKSSEEVGSNSGSSGNSQASSSAVETNGNQNIISKVIGAIGSLFSSGGGGGETVSGGFVGGDGDSGGGSGYSGEGGSGGGSEGMGESGGGSNGGNDYSGGESPGGVGRGSGGGDSDGGGWIWRRF